MSDDRCAFCDTNSEEVRYKLISSETASICDECVETVPKGYTWQRRGNTDCSFCGEQQQLVLFNPDNEADDATICRSCTILCLEILSAEDNCPLDFNAFVCDSLEVALERPRRLWILELSGIEYFPTNEITSLTNLASLTVSNSPELNWNNELAALSDIPTLISLSLVQANLKYLPPEIGKLTQLTTLGLRDNQLVELPSEIGQLIQLTELWLDNNRLESVPPQIGKLTQLTHLFIEGNRLSDLPVELGRLTHLEQLQLRHNKLTSFSPQLCQLTRLEGLNLSGNRITELPPEIGQLSKLEGLDLGYNQLRHVPQQVSRLRQLQRLTLGGNPELDFADIFRKLSKLNQLYTLNLEACQLDSLPPEIGLLTHLQKVNLNGNRLTSLPPEIAQSEWELELELEDNRFNISEEKLANTATYLNQLAGASSMLEVQLRILHYFDQTDQIDQLMDQLSIEDLFKVLGYQSGVIRRLMRQRKEQIAQQSPLEEMLRLLDHDKKLIRDWATIALSQRSTPFANSSELSGCVFYFVGRFRSVRLSEIKPLLKRAGAKVVNQLGPEVTHCAVGIAKGSVGLQAHRMGCELILGPHLQQLTNMLSPPPVSNQAADDLWPLLYSQESSKVQQGLETIMDQGLPDNLLTVITTLYRFHPDKAIKRLSNQVFHRYAPLLVQFHVDQIPKGSFTFVGVDRVEQFILCEVEDLSCGEMLGQLNCLARAWSENGAELNLGEGNLLGQGDLRHIGQSEIQRLLIALARQPQLRRLKIRGNDLTELPKEIGQLRQLKSLNISDNDFTQLPKGVVQLRQLKSLDVSCNPIANLPAEIGRLEKLEELNVSELPITKLPAEIGQLSQLKTLDVGRIPNLKFPDETKHLVNLRDLRMYKNYQLDWDNIFDKITHWSKLECLWIKECGLEHLPSTISELKNLTELEVTETNLTGLPTAIGELTKLKTLSLRNNSLQDLPQTIGKLQNLEELDVAGNPFEEFPEVILDLPNLKSLNFSDLTPEGEESLQELLPNCTIKTR